MSEPFKIPDADLRKAAEENQRSIDEGADVERVAEPVIMPISDETGRRLRMKKLDDLQSTMLMGMKGGATERQMLALMAQAVLVLIGCERERFNRGE